MLTAPGDGDTGSRRGPETGAATPVRGPSGAQEEAAGDRGEHSALDRQARASPLVWETGELNPTFVLKSKGARKTELGDLQHRLQGLGRDKEAPASGHLERAPVLTAGSDDKHTMPRSGARAVLGRLVLELGVQVKNVTLDPTSPQQEHCLEVQRNPKSDRKQ